MTYVTHEETLGCYRLQVVADESNDGHADPRDGINVGVMMANGHRRYTLGDEPHLKHCSVEVRDAYNLAERAMSEARNLVQLMRYLRIFVGATVVLPLGLIDHSGISMYVGAGAHVMDPGGWDSGLVGVIFDIPATLAETGCPPERVEEALRAEVKAYDQYLTGDVWGYVVERVDTCSHGDVHADTVDSCWGFLGDEGAIEEGRRALQWAHEHEEVSA